MNGLIDYAGLFPPAKLPLDEAIDEYISHVSDEKEWMLGRFIIPLSKLSELEKHIPKFSKIGALRLSVLGGQRPTLAPHTPSKAKVRPLLSLMLPIGAPIQ